MRRLLPGDLMFGAAYVAGKGCSMTAATRLVDEAHAAHCYAKHFDRPHPRWGSGSLMGRVLAEGVPDERPTAVFLTALIVLCIALQSRTAATVTRLHDVLDLAGKAEQGPWPKRKQR